MDDGKGVASLSAGRRAIAHTVPTIIGQGTNNRCPSTSEGELGSGGWAGCWTDGACCFIAPRTRNASSRTSEHADVGSDEGIVVEGFGMPISLPVFTC